MNAASVLGSPNDGLDIACATVVDTISDCTLATANLPTETYDVEVPSADKDSSATSVSRDLDSTLKISGVDG